MMAKSPRSKKAELADILNKLQENGFDCKGTDESKLLLLWKIYLQSEGSLKSALDNIEQLRKQQAEEMQEVENYVEHIRSLSDEREALTLEFEQENEQLKHEIDQLKQEINSGHNSETREMLLQQGLDDIAEGTTSEQVAYLLVERARLLDELEAEMQKNQQTGTTGLTEEQVEMIVKAERAEFEKELAQEQQSMKLVKQQLQEKFDGQLVEVTTRARRAEEELESAKNKIVHLEFEKEEIKCSLEHEKQTNASSHSKELEKAREEKKTAQQEILVVKGKIKTLETNNQALEETAAQLTVELKHEKERLNKELSEKDSEISRLKADCDKLHQTISSLEADVSSLEGNCKSLQMKVEFAQKDLEEAKNREREFLERKKLALDNGIKLPKDEEVELKYRDEIDQLSSRNQELTIELTSVEDKLAAEMKQKVALEEKLPHNERTIDRLQKELSSKEKELSVTNAEFKNEKTTRRNVERELECSLDRVKELEGEIANHQSVVSELKMAKDALEKEIFLRKELENKVESSKSAKLELEKVSKDKELLTNEVRSLEEDLRTTKIQLNSVESELRASKDQLELASQKDSDAAAITKKFNHLKEKYDVEKQTRQESDVQVEIMQEQIKQKGDEMEAKNMSLNVQIEDLQDKLSASKNKLADNSKKHEESTKELQQRLAEAEAERSLLQQKIKQLECESSGLNNSSSSSQFDEANSLLNTSLKTTQMKLETTQTSLKEVTTQRDQLLRLRDDLQAEIEELKGRKVVSQEDVEEQLERIHMLETVTQQLETDNRDLAEKLSEALIQNEEMEELMRKEKEKTKDSLKGNADKLHETQQHVLNLQSQVRDLEDKCLQKDTQIKRIETDFGGEQATRERTITKLNESVSQLNEDLSYTKLSHKNEVDSLGEKLENAYREVQQLRSALREKDEEIFQAQRDASKVQSSTGQLEVQLASEERLRHDLEERNKVLEAEMTKAWNQMRDLMEKISTLETDKQRLEEEHLVHSPTSRQPSSSSLLSSLDRNNPNVQLAMSRAEEAERKRLSYEAASIQTDLDDAKAKLQLAETELKEASSVRVELQACKDEIIRLNNQLKEEEMQRAMEGDRVGELKRQLLNLQEKETKSSTQNHELQHTVLDLESTIGTIKEETELVSDLQRSTEQSKLVLSQQLSSLQQERETLQLELLAATEKYNLQVKRYDSRKMRHKAKLQKARELYSLEKCRLREKAKTLEEDLSLTKASLTQEVQWKMAAEEKNKQLSLEKRQLITQNAELEESVRDKSRQVSVLTVRAKYLEDETLQLEQRVASLTKQKSNLDKLVKDQSLLVKQHSFHELQRASSPLCEPATPSVAQTATSGLGNSLSSSQAWDPHLLDAMLTTVTVRERNPEHSMNGLSRTISFSDTNPP